MKNENILRGVPKAYYGAYGGITPFPICLKSVSDYLGDELDYNYAIVACGGAFRLVWDTTSWNGGNVDIMLTYDDLAETPFRYGINALGREFNIVWRNEDGWDRKHIGNASKEDIKNTIREQIDIGKPVIALGPVGPGEAGIITGYRENGDVLLGWSVFQSGAGVTEFDEQDGYFIVNDWWEKSNHRDFHGIMTMGEITKPRYNIKTIIENGIAALEGRIEGKYAKGIAAYDAWKNAILNTNKTDFKITEVLATNIGLWPLETPHDPALDDVGIPDGTHLYGLFAQNYTKYAAPENIQGLSQVYTLAELTDGMYYILNASSGFDYVLTTSPTEVTAFSVSDIKDIMMCQGDATDCLIDGRGRARLWFENLAETETEQQLYLEISKQFGIVESIIDNKIYKILGGYNRDPKQILKLSKQDVRNQIGEYIDEMKAADERALALMKELFTKI